MSRDERTIHRQNFYNMNKNGFDGQMVIPPESGQWLDHTDNNDTKNETEDTSGADGYEDDGDEDNDSDDDNDDDDDDEDDEEEGEEGEAGDGGDEEDDGQADRDEDDEDHDDEGKDNDEKRNDVENEKGKKSDPTDDAITRDSAFIPPETEPTLNLANMWKKLTQAHIQCIYILIFLLTCFVLAAAVSAYLLLGALYFTPLEAGAETRTLQSLDLVRDGLFDKAKSTKMDIGKEKWLEHISAEVAVYEDHLLQVYRKRLGGAEASKNIKIWTIYGSAIFCGSVITTIGWGNVTPQTVTGRLSCIVYAVFGIPLLFSFTAVLSTVSNVLIDEFWNWITRKTCGEKPEDQEPFDANEGPPYDPLDANEGPPYDPLELKGDPVDVQKGGNGVDTSGNYRDSQAAMRSNRISLYFERRERDGSPNNRHVVHDEYDLRFKPDDIDIEELRKERDDEYLSSLQSTVDFCIAASDKTENDCIEMPHYILESKEDANKFSRLLLGMSNRDMLKCMKYAEIDCVASCPDEPLLFSDMICAIENDKIFSNSTWVKTKNESGQNENEDSMAANPFTACSTQYSNQDFSKDSLSIEIPTSNQEDFTVHDHLQDIFIEHRHATRRSRGKHTHGDLQHRSRDTRGTKKNTFIANSKKQNVVHHRRKETEFLIQPPFPHCHETKSTKNLSLDKGDNCERDEINSTSSYLPSGYELICEVEVPCNTFYGQMQDLDHSRLHIDPCKGVSSNRKHFRALNPNTQPVESLNSLQNEGSCRQRKSHHVGGSDDMDSFPIQDNSRMIQSTLGKRAAGRHQEQINCQSDEPKHRISWQDSYNDTHNMIQTHRETRNLRRFRSNERSRLQDKTDFSKNKVKESVHNFNYNHKMNSSRKADTNYNNADKQDSPEGFGPAHHQDNNSDNMETIELSDESEEEDLIQVPFYIYCMITIGYILIGGLLFKDLSSKGLYTDGIYFTFVMLTTIGFGDIVPGQNYYIMTLIYGALGFSLANSVTNMMINKIVDILEAVNTLWEEKIAGMNADTDLFDAID